METMVFCPDCGGVIGGDGRDGRKPCACFDVPKGPRPGMPDPVEKVKVCCKCGKELEGKKRFRDSLGYWCEACHFSEKREEKQKHVPCDACGRYVEPRKLQQYDTITICTRCLKERKRQARKVRRPVVFGTEHQKHEKKTFYTLAVIAGVLLLLILLSYFGLL